MSFWIALFFPALPLDVFARAWSPEQHARVFVIDTGGHVPRIVAANQAAQDAGVRDNMLLSAAYVLAPSLVQQACDLDAEAAALAQLATFALRFTPAVSLAPPAALVADIGGSLKLFGGRTQLVSRLIAGTKERGFSVQAAVAPTPLAALALARANRRCAIESTSALFAALAPLPLSHFDVPEATWTTLAAAGVTTFGDADRLPRDGLARRFGPDLVHALDRALGRAPDPRVAYTPPPKFASKLELPAPIDDVEALGFAVNRLVQELSGWLLAHGLGVVSMSLTLAHEHALVRHRDSPTTDVRFALGAPSRTSKHLMHVLRERLARLSLAAPVAAISLASDDVAPLAGRNLGLLPGDEAVVAEVPLVDRLRARLGDDAVCLVVAQEEHRPERAMQISRSTVTRKTKADSTLPSARRPLWLLSEPQPLSEILERQPWVLRDGPERIESGWWDGHDVRRDYFVAENPAGEIVWVYRDHRYGVDDGEWFLHGVFA
ncbi:MAG TPA: DNA polymerase Y family protein [Casimicrobiaceae bacterium]|nr:DNA polymerase Y family protein [Casimicrobiaceae bacterium]